ncbi:hypothetical protein AS033_08775 [Exiguobacterium indicum]|uniref:DUF4003 domain-containing protein n=1 Tax=Exiguobacterium indicum TaxID=296995 RepID=A0A0V8GH29_9BACL|nr:DUF4003 family protein [Exiguobacterium enclense]KSU49450.1 hypothetical protein AS033_08775 [Exiguobacterium enclense]SDC59680.1 Protein of unknown function [Exiguobacterium enclense]
MEIATTFLRQLDHIGPEFRTYQDGILIELAFDRTIGTEQVSASVLLETAYDLKIRLRTQTTQALLLASKIHAFDTHTPSRIAEMMSIHGYFKSHRLSHPLNAYSTALFISRLTPQDAVLERTVQLYTRLKKQHRFIVSPLLISFVYFHATTRGELDELASRIETVYQRLKRRFGRAQQTYVVALIFALLPEDDWDRYIAQVEASRKIHRKHHVPLSFHGMLALLGDPNVHTSSLERMAEALRSDLHFKYRKDLVYLTAIRLYLSQQTILQQLFPSSILPPDGADAIPFLLFPVDLTDTSHATDGGIDGGFDGGGDGGGGGE